MTYGWKMWLEYQNHWVHVPHLIPQSDSLEGRAPDSCILTSSLVIFCQEV